MICENCGSDMIESVTECNVYVCEYCQSVTDVFDDNEWLQSDYQYIDGLFDAVEDDNFLLTGREVC